MKALAILVITFLSLAVSAPQAKQEDFGLPELHRIKTITLSPSYSCQHDAQPGYGNTALFLSTLSRRRNTPELVFEGSCGGEDSLHSMTAGDDVGVIADLEEMSLEKVTARLAFNSHDEDSFDLYSKFAQQVKARSNHTYAILIGRAEIKSLFVVTVTGYIPNKKLDLEYAVKEYQVLQLRAQSPGFDWVRENTF